MGVSAPRFSIAAVGGGLYIAADGYLTGFRNSQEQDACCSGDRGEGGDSADDVISDVTAYNQSLAKIDELERELDLLFEELGDIITNEIELSRLADEFDAVPMGPAWDANRKKKEEIETEIRSVAQRLEVADHEYQKARSRLLQMSGMPAEVHPSRNRFREVRERRDTLIEDVVFGRRR